MLAHSQSQTLYPPVFQPGMPMSPSYGSQNQVLRPVPLEIQQMQLQQQIQMEMQQRQHQQMLEQHQQGFMQTAPSLEEQLLLARAQFDFEARARAQAEAQTLAQPFIHPGYLSQHPYMSEMYDSGINPVQPSMSMGAMQVQPTFHAETLVQNLHTSSESGFETNGDEQDVLGYSMENFYRSTNASARQRTQQACEKCRDRKTKCSGTRPMCQRCSDRGLNCVWAPETRTRGIARQFRFSRSSIDCTIDRSLPGSPSLRSAPATQTVFPTFIGNEYREKRGSWNGGQGNLVVRGERALSMIGGPIESLHGADEGWEAISEAKLATPEIAQSAAHRPRAISVSVAHMARSRDLHRPLQIGPLQVNTNIISTTGCSSESSPPMSSESMPRTASECSEPPIFTLEDTLSSHISELYAPQPSYDTASLLSDEMLRLLHFPDPSSKAASVINEGGDDSATPSTTKDFMSQFLTDDIFDG